jgi:transposase/transposase IS116/IS110/IS902 family protein
VTPVTWFVGIDWARERHQVCIVNREGRLVAQQQIEHTAAALQGFVEQLLTRADGDPTRIAIAIEVPRGAVVELLVERGFAVYAINPKQLDRFRDRFTAAGAKDDRFDAHVLADSLRTDRPAFRRVQLDHPLIIQIREWSRVDDALQVEFSELTNRLRDLIYRIAPGLLRLSPAADDAWLWALLDEAATPAAQRQLSEWMVAQLLRTHRVRRVTAAELVAVLREPVPYTAPGVVEAVTAHIQVILPRLQLAARQRRDAARELARMLDTLAAQPPADGDQREHADVTIVRSMPGIGTRIAARMLAEASQPLAERAYYILRGLLGVAPITQQSGKRKQVLMRRGCNARLRQAAYHWARVATQRDDASRAYYRALRLRGQPHGCALRSVANRLLRILCALLRHGQLFNPEHQRTLVSDPVAL